MKFCPYCGNELLGEDALFCMECGKQMPDRNLRETTTSNSGVDERMQPEEELEHQSTMNNEEAGDQIVADPDDGYDGYYDDVIPDDHGNVRAGVDKQLIKKITVLGVSVILIICACVAIMYIL